MNTELNKQLHALLHKASLTQAKPHLVESYTNGRTNTSKEMTDHEATELITYLRSKVGNQQPTPNHHPPPSDPAQTMRRKIISLAHQLNWRSAEGKADMARINNWCEKYGYLHKPLNAYTIAELPKLLTQFQNFFKTVL